MRSSTRFTLVLAFVLTCAGVLSAQENQKNKGGSITGRVTMANKGVAGVTVTITMSGDALSGSGLKLKAITDDEGRFRISNLPPRTYYVWPFLPAFVIAEATGGYPQGKSVSVLEGETAEEINFTLIRGAVITGKVTDSTGRILVDERVRIVPVEPNLRKLINSDPVINDLRTDDRGIYRAFGLPGGAYKVAIGDSQFAAFTSTGGRRFYPVTFHPDVTDEAKAEVVQLAEGGEVNGVDITVARAMTGYSARGRFVDSANGQAVPNINFGLTIVSDKSESRGYLSLRNVSTDSGSFQIDNLGPGNYAVTVLSSFSNSYYGASETFAIRDSDVSDIEVKVHRGSTLSGTLIVEGTTDRTIPAKLARAQLKAYTWSEGNSVGTVIYTEINADGSFQISPLRPGKLSIDLGSIDRNATPDFALLAIELNGVDKSQGIQIREGEDISGVKLVAGYGTGVIRGTVRIEGGTLPAGTFMDAALIRPGSSLTIASTTVDVRGQFVFERVPPGNYEVGVNAYLQGGPVSARQAIVTSNGVATEVTVVLKLNANPKSGP